MYKALESDDGRTSNSGTGQVMSRYEDFLKVSSEWSVHICLAFGIYFLFRKFGGSVIQSLFFAEFYKRCMGVYHEECRDMKKQHFASLRDHTSADPELRKKGAIRILEIGAASGYNFEFYPAGSELTVVEVNPFFEKQFFGKQNQYPHIVMKRFVVGFAEDMKHVEDNSVDIVVSTMVLCSVRSIEKTLKEVHRVLAPGGKYYYWEHIRDQEVWWIRWIQHLATFTFYDTVFGCHLNRTSDRLIKDDKTFSSIQQQFFRTPLQRGLWKIHSFHVKGVASK